jgi:ankyrin repeat protein
METTHKESSKPIYIEDLYTAFKTGKFEKVQQWVEQGVNPNRQHKDKILPLYFTVLSFLYDSNTDLNQAILPYETPLYRAVNVGHFELTKLLIKSGVNVNEACHDETPLCNAAFYGYTEIVKLLIDANADVNQADRDGTTPLYMAIMFNKTDVVKLLIENNANVNQATIGTRTPLFAAAEDSNFEVVKLLLQHDAAINTATTDSSETPAHAAARGGQLEVLKLLIDYGADINRVDHSQQTPLDTASANGSSDVVELLQQAMKPWCPTRHYLAPRKAREQIGTTMKLALKNTQLTRLPKDVLLIICMFVATQNTDQDNVEPARKKQRRH